MTFLSNLFPKITTSRKKLIEHIIITCKARNIEEEKKEKWAERVRNSISTGTYFWNMIYINPLEVDVLIHEFIHHIIEHVRVGTKSDKWDLLHYLNDDLYIFIYIREK